MIRCMMLALTLMLITLSAAYLGRDEQLRQVLRQTKTPVASSLPAGYDGGEPPQPPEASSAAAPQNGQPPRFVPDEPIQAAPQGAPEPEAAQEPSQRPPEPALPPIDPSSEAKLYPVESSEGQYEHAPPTEEQKLAAAEPYVKELFELTERGAGQLRQLADEVVGEYLAVPPEQRSASLPALIEKYTPRAIELETSSDEEAEAILLRMTAALVAIGGDDGLVNDARAAYERSKQQQTAHYSDLLAAFSP